MAYVEVNHRSLEQTATEIDSYISRQKSKTNSITGIIDGLNSSWQGADYNQLKSEWQHFSSADSALDNMVKSLDGYAEFLRYAAQKYKEAQANAVNRANRLPRY